MVKARAIRKAEVDAREAAAREERERGEAEANVRGKAAVTMRLVLWLVRYVWPRLTAEERSEIKTIIPDEMETEIRDALRRLP